jgi:hypothetical protein
MQSQHVGPGIMADHIQELVFFYNPVQIQVRIQDTFFFEQWAGYH